MVIHILTPQGEKMVVQVVDGNVIVPSAKPTDPATGQSAAGEASP